MKAIATWEHAGLMVSAAPLAWVVLASTGLTACITSPSTRRSAAAAEQLLAKLTAGNLEARHMLGVFRGSGNGPGGPQSGRQQVGGWPASTRRRRYTFRIWIEKYLESRVRAEPEMVKRTAAAQGQYAIRFRLDKSYRKVTVSWMRTHRLCARHRQVRARTGVRTIGAAQPETAAPGSELR